MERTRNAAWSLLILCWLSLWLWSYLLRPLWPIDETRYVSVAWEMWERRNFLVPYLNGHPYSHKPPLLFWLIHLGWALFGVNDWWPRLVPSLFGLGGAYLTARITEKLWPNRKGIGQISALTLIGLMPWAAFCTVVMFDLILSFFVLLAILGGLYVIEGKGRIGTLMMGAGLGLGVLSKGPVIFIHTLPVLCLSPWWARNKVRIPLRSAMAYFALALVLGVMVALAWVIPAAARGGEAYRRAILWGQTAHRITSSFAHRRPLWWYIPWLPLLLSPWILFPPFWRGIFRKRPKDSEGGLRFSLSWILPTLIIFSLLSGKQIYYLLPMVPAFAILVAAVTWVQGQQRRLDMLPLAIFYALLGLGLVAAHAYLKRFHGSQSFGLIGGIILLTIAGSMMSAGLKGVFGRITLVLIATTVSLMVVELAVVRAVGEDYDIRKAAAAIKEYESEGLPVAHTGKYHGQFHFLGRLRKPFAIIRKKDIDAWLEQHPRGRVITYFHKAPASINTHRWQLLYSQPYRGATLVILGKTPGQLNGNTAHNRFSARRIFFPCT